MRPPPNTGPLPFSRTLHRTIKRKTNLLPDVLKQEQHHTLTRVAKPKEPHDNVYQVERQHAATHDGETKGATRPHPPSLATILPQSSEAWPDSVCISTQVSN